MTAAAGRTGRPLVLTRRLDAPRDRVFAAFTRLDDLRAWMGPAGVAMVDCTLDPRPGGVFHYGMRLPTGVTMYGSWTFREIVAPERLVVVVSFSDAAGGVARHPMVPTWPLSTLSTTTFAEDGAGTLLTVQWQALDATDVESMVFDASHGPMTQGWAGTFAQLEAHLAAARCG
jgi:uncharacterized protein YndB with AHSA1/START domain